VSLARRILAALPLALILLGGLLINAGAGVS
jgi:hypothetical protein